jgi:SWI/SNF-related matrix-associated actin-dependent regulator of chromatin subfamily A member 5
MAKTPAMARTWARLHFNLLILDEGHRIKGRETQISKAVRRIHAETRCILTGTPLANNLVELYSLLSFLVPDIFTTAQPFEEAFNLSLNIFDPQKLMQANKLLDVFMIRRLKVQVEKLMPPKIETKVVCPLSNTQIWWYKAVLLKDISILARSNDDDDSEAASNKTKAGRLNNLLMQLRKVCLHPFLFPLAEDVDDNGEPTSTLENLVGSSGKLAVLDKLLRSLFIKQQHHRVCLFSQFTSVLDILQDYCDLRGWKYCRLDGSTSRAKRNFVINNFNAPNSDKFLFLMSTRSGVRFVAFLMN